MSFSAKKFQSATINAVVAAFARKGSSSRFLVADEAGLGKTVVARGVIKELMVGRTTPLTVFYVCSNQAIASQNVDQLLSVLPDEEARRGARASVDRPSLLPLSTLPTSKTLRIFSLTPGTAFSLGSKGASRGHYQERALACVLVEDIKGERMSELRSTMKMDASGFPDCVKYYENCLDEDRRRNDPMVSKIVHHFRRTLRYSLNVEDGEHLWPKLEALRVNGGNELASRLRNAVSCAALEALNPDLIIFDEFQRFRDVMRHATKSRARESGTPEERLQAKLLDILTAGKAESHLLLLSATPYEAERAIVPAKKTRKKIEPEDEKPHESDFFEVLNFLSERQPDFVRWRLQVRESFEVVERELRKGQPHSPEATLARAHLSKSLMRVMCRTERPRSAARESIQSLKEQDAIPRDIQVFRDFSGAVEPANHGWTVPLWSSVPAPIQTLGAAYKCWPEKDKAIQSVPVLSAADARKWVKPRVWPNSKLRGLMDSLVHSNLEMPWIRPSKEWWTLKGGWLAKPDKTECDGKMLVFSRFSGAPGAISGLLSYTVEAGLFPNSLPKANYSDITRGSKFKPGGQSPGMFQLFFCSPFLAELDPLKKGIPGTPGRALAVVEQQLRAKMKEKFPGIAIHKRKKAKLIPLHILLIAIAQKNGDWMHSRRAWVDALTQSGVDERGVSKGAVESILRQWEALVPAQITLLHETKELRPLAELALSSPATVVARALKRHRGDAFDSTPSRKRMPRSPAGQLQSLLLNGFKRYFDKPWFAAALSRGYAKERFSKSLMRAVVEGNLEATLDEHFWLLERTSSSEWPVRLEDLQNSLNVEGGRSTFHEKGKGSEVTRLRCHVAMPLRPATSQKKGKNAISRPDQIRHAFNTPFWPFIVTTTSVGQEGLDFHLWCRSIGHWDLAPGPVELEQREGRVSRFAGLSVRRALATHEQIKTFPVEQSPWQFIARRADEIPELVDPQELSPWWHLPDAHTRQHYFPMSGSREIQQIKTLERKRALYRMVFGVADPEHLLGELGANTTITPEVALQTSIRLGAWERKFAS